jgi:hypothetical protein
LGFDSVCHLYRRNRVHCVRALQGVAGHFRQADRAYLPLAFELRQRAHDALGDKFDVRAFHDAVLADGPLPLDVLESRINAWIGSQK